MISRSSPFTFHHPSLLNSNLVQSSIADGRPIRCSFSKKHRTMAKFPKEFLELCRSVTGKRPKTVIDHILKHGHITTEELKSKYGYDHPPRAARDVRELGIDLETFRVEASNGRKIAAYRFADPTKRKFRRFEGRTGLSKKIKDQLIEKYGCRCFIYLETMD